METSILSPEPQALSPSSSGRRSSASNSPEFEFWMVRNPSCPQPNLLSADELFVDGVLLPLRLLHLHPNGDLPDHTPQDEPQPPNSEPPSTDPGPAPDPEPEPSPAITESTTSFSASKRWKDIFKKSDKKNSVNSNSTEDRDREKDKKERKSGNGASSSAELNINIWPFSRSRSAGNAGTRPKMFPGALGSRKVNSAPCSRSNSAGESKSRKWPSSPGRPRVHLGRSSPVWQVKRSGSGTKNNSDPLARNAEKGSKKEALEARRSKTATKGGGGSGGGNNGKAKVLNLNVPMCIGYGHHLSCRSDESGTIGVVGAGGSGGGNRGNGGGSDSSGGGNVRNSGNLFNLRNLFSKKNVLTSH